MQTNACVFDSQRLAGAAATGVPLTYSQRLSSVFASRPDRAGLLKRRRSIMQVSATAAPEMGTPVATAGTEVSSRGKYQLSDFASAFNGQLDEFDYWITDIEGEVPSTLRGTLFRNGPGRFERGGQDYAHVLDGDGYILQFSFNAEGRVHFKSAYVQTGDLQKEAQADRVLYKSIFGTTPKKRFGELPNVLDLYVKNPANTNVVLWGGKLLALWEGGGPWALDPHTLATYPGPDPLGGFLSIPKSKLAQLWDGAVARVQAKGPGKADGKVKACTAHPHVVHGAGSLDRLAIYSSQIQVSSSGLEAQIEVAEFDEQWQKVAGQSFTMKNTVFVPHDFAVSQSYYVFCQSEADFEMTQFLLGKKAPAQCLNLVDRAMKIHLVPRNGDAPFVVDGEEPCFLIHHANAYEEGDDVVLVAIGWGPDIVKPVASQPGSGVFGTFSGGDYNKVPVTSLWSYRINVKTKKVERERLWAQRNDHPKVNSFFYSRPTRYYYVNACVPEGENVSNPPQAFARVDSQTGEKQVWFPGIRCFCEELVFMPGPNAATQETDGYLLGLVFDAAEQRTFLAVLDAADLNKGPVAKLWLKHHVPHGLHGYWSPKYYGPAS